MLRKVCILFLVGVAALAEAAAAASVLRVEISGGLDVTEQQFSLELECREVGTAGRPPDLFGHSTASPPCVLARFELVVGSHSIEVPLAAYADLANPTFLGGVGIIESEDSFAVHLKGGDGENTYAAEFRFAGNQLRRREVTTWNEYGRPIVDVREFSDGKQVTDSP